jgi:rubrerythrin
VADSLSLANVLELARTMETNGADFYRRSAALYKKPEDGGFFLCLAKMEEDHEHAFARLEESLPPGPSSADATGADELFEASGVFLQALIDSENLEGSGFARYVFTGRETPSQVVLMGVELEKATILYYMGLRDLFSLPEERNVIETIIKEEKDHLGTLIREYRRLKAGGK